MIVGLGMDVVEIDRLRDSLSRFAESFKRKVFTPEEQAFCDARTDSVPHYAVRFAAKEAAFKALGTGWAQGVTWLDVEIQRFGQDPPVLLLRGESEKRAHSLGAYRYHVSLSHSKSSAVAVVILEG